MMPGDFNLSQHFKTCSLTAICSLILCSSIWGESPLEQPERAIPQLKEILDSAGKNAPSLIEQNYLREEADQRLKQAKSSYYPSVDLRANLGYRQEYRSGGAEDTSNFGLNYSAQLTRPLYHWGAIEARIEQARIDNDVQALEYLQNTQQIYRDIRSDYLTLLLNATSLNNEQLKKSLLENDIERLRGDYQAGNISELEYETKVLDLQNSLLIIQSIQRDQQRIIARFKQNAGWSDQLELEAGVPSVDLDRLNNWLKGNESYFSSEESLEGLIIQQAIKRQNEELTIIQARQRPLVNFAASVSQGQSNTSTQNNVTTLSLFGGVSVSWNIFDGFRTKHQKIEAKLAKRRLEAHLDRLSEDLNLEQQNMLDQMQAQVDKTKVLEKRFQLQNRSFSTSQNDAQSGRLSTSDLNQAKLELEELKLDLMESRAVLLMHISDYLDLTQPELRSVAQN